MPGKNEWAVAGYSGCWELLMSGTVPASVDYETYVNFGISLFLSATGSHVPQASLTPVT